MNVVAPKMPNKIKNIDLKVDDENQFVDKEFKKVSFFETLLLFFKSDDKSKEIDFKKLVEKNRSLLDSSNLNENTLIEEIENIDFKSEEVFEIEKPKVKYSLKNDIENEHTILSNENKTIEKKAVDNKTTISNKTILKTEKIDILHRNFMAHLMISKRVEQEIAINEIKEAKSIDDILKVAKKFNLNIKSIDLKQEKEQNQERLEVKIEPNKIKNEINSEKTLQQKQAILNIQIEKSKKISNSKNTTLKHNIASSNSKKEDYSLKELLQKSNFDKDKNIEENSKERIVLEPNSSIIKKSDAKMDDAKIEPKFEHLDEKVSIDESSKRQNEKRLENIETKNRVVETIKIDESKKEKTEQLSNNKEIETIEAKRTTELENSIKPSEIVKQKVIDAKQMVLSFAKTLQEQVENYKPPFTKMQLSLDPEDLGKVDITLISRGKNLHIQVNSNPIAIGIMATQGVELKNQLVSMGFSDVQMQFNMNQQQQQQQDRRKTSVLKEYIKIDEISEVDSLEIIVPNYA